MDRQRKRVEFIVLLLSILFLLLFNQFILKWLFSNEAGWPIYIIIALLTLILLSPNIEAIRTKEIELELRSPLSFEPFLSPLAMETGIKDIVSHERVKR